MNKKIQNMDAIFNPQSVALVGASDDPGKLGAHTFQSLTEGGFDKKLFPVNPKQSKINGIQCYHSLKDIPNQIDLSVVIVPAGIVYDVIKESIEKGVKGTVLISGGFKEIDDKTGSELQAAVADLANQAAMPIIGPNTMGIMNIRNRLNATFAPGFCSGIKEGRIGVITQSSGMISIITHLASSNNIGLGKLLSLGNRCNIDFSDALAYLMEDPDTEIICMYMEGMDNPRRLLDTAKKYRGKKPVVVYKTGRSTRSNQSSLSHTGSLAGNHKIYEASFRQTGILSVDSLEEMIDTIKIIDTCPLPGNGEIAILTGQAGPSIAASDVCEKGGLTISPFKPSTQKMINEILPPLSIRSNPVDIGPFWYKLEYMEKSLRVICEDESISAVLLILLMGEANKNFLFDLSAILKKWGKQKPIVCCFAYRSNELDAEVKNLEDSSSVVSYPTPERAGQALSNLWLYKKTLLSYQ